MMDLMPWSVQTWHEAWVESMDTSQHDLFGRVDTPCYLQFLCNISRKRNETNNAVDNWSPALFVVGTALASLVVLWPWGSTWADENFSGRFFWNTRPSMLSVVLVVVPLCNTFQIIVLIYILCLWYAACTALAQIFFSISCRFNQM